MLITVLAFLLTIGVLVVIHEYGHYRAAVACDVKVLRFSVGFGRVLWRRQKGDTEFVLSALPFGGYVKMLDEREGEVPAADRARAFNHKPLRQRAFIVAAGPAANLLLAVVLYAVVNWVGVQELRPRVAAPVAGSALERAGVMAGDEIVAIGLLSGSDADMEVVRSFTDLQFRLTDATIQGQDVRLGVQRAGDPSPSARLDLALQTSRIPPADVDANLMDRLGFIGPYARAEVGRVTAGGPAEAAGLLRGDVIVAIEGRAVADAASFRRQVASSVADGQIVPMVLTVEREGRRIDVTVTPRWADDAASPGGRVPRIQAEIGSSVDRVTVRHGLVDGAVRAVSRTWEVSALSLNMLGKMLLGQASLKNLSGPITIADYAGKSVELGWTYYLGFLALVSVSLGVLNLLPLPVLDGGHLMYYLFEGVTGRPVSEPWLERLQKGGVALMLLMMSLALYNDIARLLGMH